MNYESNICSSCGSYGGFGRCIAKWNQKCKDCYSDCIVYRNKYNAKHNPWTEDKVKNAFMNKEIDYDRARNLLLQLDSDLTNSDAQGIVDLWENILNSSKNKSPIDSLLEQLNKDNKTKEHIGTIGKDQFDFHAGDGTIYVIKMKPYPRPLEDLIFYFVTADEKKKIYEYFCEKEMIEKLYYMARNKDLSFIKFISKEDYTGCSKVIKDLLKVNKYRTEADEWGYFEEKCWGLAIKPNGDGTYAIRNNTEERTKYLAGATTKSTEEETINAIKEMAEIRKHRNPTGDFQSAVDTFNAVRWPDRL